jgi:uncharacterized membrane protein YdjX (TVP38/TMEM64 family)
MEKRILASCGGKSMATRRRRLGLFRFRFLKKSPTTLSSTSTKDEYEYQPPEPLVAKSAFSGRRIAPRIRPMSALLNSLALKLAHYQHFFQDMGWLGVLAFAGLALVIQLTLAPLSPVAIVGGFIFGLTRGVIAMELGTAAGIVVNFLFARYVARDAIKKRLARNEKFRLIDEAIGREGGKIIFVLRFCPIPFGLSNFCYGLTAVRFWPYFFASVGGIIPGNFFFTWLGATAQDLQGALSHNRPRHPFELAMMISGPIAFFIALTYVTKIARAAVTAGQGGKKETVDPVMPSKKEPSDHLAANP